MSTSEQIEDQKPNIGSLLNLKCSICRGPSWNQYYGNDACRNCLRFFLISIRDREEYRCPFKEQCSCYFYRRNRCDFCLMNRCIKKGLKPIRFGRHADGWYMKDVEQNLSKTPTVEQINLDALVEIKNFQWMFRDYREEFQRWMRGYVSNSENIKDVIMKKFEERGAILKIVEDSFYVHDTIKLRNCYFNPYECQSAQLQYLLIQILMLCRQFREILLEKNFDLEIKKSLIFFRGIKKEKKIENVLLHNQLEIITVWLNVCQRFFDQLPAVTITKF